MKKNKEEETELPFMNGSNGHGEMKNSKVCSRSNNIFLLLVLVVAGCFRSQVHHSVSAWGGSLWLDF